MLSHRRRKEIAGLGRKKHREALGQMLVEGVRSVEAAVAAGAPLVEIVVTAAAREDARVQAVLAGAGVPVLEASARDLEQLSDVQTSQGVVAVARIERLPEDRLGACTAVLALDGVQDPGNVGTLLRTAAWFGADAVVAGAGTADLFGPKVVRAAMGGLWDVGLAQADDLAGVLAGLRARGHAVYGADLGGTPVRRWQPARPSVLVLGSEAHGLSRAVRAGLDARVAIGGAEGRVGTESLNVAVAGGILIHAWLGAP